MHFNRGLTVAAEFWPKGVEADKVTTINSLPLKVHFLQGSEKGSNEIGGDGTVQNRDTGRGVRRSAKIAIPVGLDIKEQQRADRPDLFVIDSERWYVKRIEKRDAYTVTVDVFRRPKRDSVRRVDREG